MCAHGTYMCVCVCTLGRHNHTLTRTTCACVMLTSGVRRHLATASAMCVALVKLTISLHPHCTHQEEVQQHPATRKMLVYGFQLSEEKCEEQTNLDIFIIHMKTPLRRLGEHAHTCVHVRSTHVCTRGTRICILHTVNMCAFTRANRSACVFTQGNRASAKHIPAWRAQVCTLRTQV